MESREETTKYAYWSNKLSLPSDIPVAAGFIGQNRELQTLLRAKETGKTIFVLHGVSGAGKTYLALKFCEEIKPEFEAHILINMSSLSVDEAKLKIISAFNPKVQSNLNEKDFNDIYNSLLNQHKTLLLLDNVENKQQIELLIHSNAFFITTSRKKLTILNSFSLEVGRLQLNIWEKIFGSPYNSFSNAGVGIIGASLLPVLPVAMPLLAGATAFRLFSQSAKDSFDKAYEKLDKDTKKLLSKLAVFQSDFEIEAIKKISEIENIENQLLALQAFGWIYLNTEKSRVSIHRLTRDYILKKLNPVELYETQKRYTFYYGEILRNLNEVTNNNLAKFDLEQINIEHGFKWIKENLNTDETLAPVCLLYTSYAVELLQLKLQPEVFIEWMKIGILASRIIRYKQGENNHLLNLSIAYRNTGDFRKSIDYTEQALKLSNELGDRQRESLSLNNLGTACYSLGDYVKAIYYFQQSLALSREIRNRQNESNNLGSLANVFAHTARYEEAIEYYEQALAISRETGDLYNQGNLLGNLGNCYRRIGLEDKAIAHYEKALSISRQIGDRQGEGSWLGNLGVAFANSREFQKAIDYCEEALIIARELGDRHSEGNWLGQLGKFNIVAKNYQKAIDYYIQSISIARELGDKNKEGIRLDGLGTVYAKSGEKQKAIDTYIESIAILRSLDSYYAQDIENRLAELNEE